MSRPVYLICVALFCLTWSSAFIAAKFAIAIAPPLLFLGIRFTLAGLILLGFAAIVARWKIQGRPSGRGRGLGGNPDGGGGIPWLQLGALGIVNWASYQGTFWVGMRSSSAGMATVIGSLSPIVIAAVAVPVLGERLTARRLLGLLLALGGTLAVVHGRLAGGESGTGVLYFVAGLLAMVAGTLGYKRLSLPVSLPVAVGAQQLGAGLCLLALGSATESYTAIQFGPQFVLTMAWFVGIVSICSFLLWFLLLRQGTAASASALHFLMPPIGLLMAWAVLGEPLEAADLIGVVPIAAGIWLVTRSPAAPQTPAIATAAPEA